MIRNQALLALANGPRMPALTMPVRELPVVERSSRATLSDYLIEMSDDRNARFPQFGRATLDQVVQGVHAGCSWWALMLDIGHVPERPELAWGEAQPLELSLDDLWESYTNVAPTFGSVKAARATRAYVSKFVREMAPGTCSRRSRTQNGGRSTVLELSPLQVLRTWFACTYGRAGIHRWAA